MDLYFDGFCCIGIREDTGSGYYSDISMEYFEFPASIAKYIAKRMRENLQHGSMLIDYIAKNKVYNQNK